MASTWITTRTTKDGARRYRVMWRSGGRESSPRYGGSFKRKADALERKRWISGELAGRRIPDLRSDAPETVTLRALAERWQASRVDVSAGTMQTYRVALGRLLPRLGDEPVEKIDAQRVAGLVAELHAAGLKKQTIRKTLSVAAMVFDHGRIEPNPWRDRLTVKLPREERRELHPPTAEHVEAVVRLLPTRYRLPALVLDATGMRIGELEALTWGDVDEPRQRWRVSGAVAKTGRARWVPVPDLLFEAVTRLVAREDRIPERPVFQGFAGDRFRTAITRACTAAAVPQFSPHDLRHRRVSLLHLGGMPWARIGELVGHDDLMTTARTYTHVLTDEQELDYARLVLSPNALPLG
ncbi:MAG TPA: site-specific integrase [Gaiellaceae bacterium]|nr:site-specific integrase [Gaiellaceae bacterium]